MSDESAVPFPVSWEKERAREVAEEILSKHYGRQREEELEKERILLMEFQDFYQMCTEEEAKDMVDQFFDER